eukprot:1195754-Prorocentrum_minimum.AAC.1
MLPAIVCDGFPTHAGETRDAHRPQRGDSADATDRARRRRDSKCPSTHAAQLQVSVYARCTTPS